MATALPPMAAPFMRFPSRRSTVASTRGIVSSTQPLANEAGLRILRNGGNAADAAVAMAAALNVTEPCSTGIGGDMFCLFYNASSKSVRAINGSGRTGKGMTLERIRADLGLPSTGRTGSIPLHSVHSVTVPGAAAGWVDCVGHFGSGNISLLQILTPAIELAEGGFPVSDLTSSFWASAENLLLHASPNGWEMLKKSDGRYRAPRRGEVKRNPTLANTFRHLAAGGKKGFYEGPVADEIIKACSDLGGHLTKNDLKEYGKEESRLVDPISFVYKGQSLADHASHGIRIFETPPNSQGIVALMAFGLLEELEKTGKIKVFGPADHNSTEYIHAIIECLRIAFADADWFVTDPEAGSVPTSSLLSAEYLADRAKLFNPSRASDIPHHGTPPPPCGSDTVYFAVTDAFGNACSFVNSNYVGFGTGIVPKDCGFTLQNRGCNFSLDPEHPNALAPCKRPYHTIITNIVTNPKDDSLYMCGGVMGGFMQPQGHLQVILNSAVFNLTPQEALDAPRICIGAGMPDEGDVADKTVYVEEGFDPEVVDRLIQMGHQIVMNSGHARARFGRGQLITVHHDDCQRVYSAGSDLRGDGAASAL